MKKVLFSAHSLEIGGIETALITLLKELHLKYKITLVLEKKQGIFLKEIPKDIKVITYTPSEFKIPIIRKAINFVKQQLFKVKYQNKFDFSACYATYSYSSAFVARKASKNCALWVHNDYMSFYENDINKYKDFFNKLKSKEFKKIIFVSESDKNVFCEQFEEYKDKCIICNNLIDYNKVKEKAKKEISDFEPNENITFINIGRHDEAQKKLSRIINSTKRLNEQGYKFRVLFIGNGKDFENYKNQAKNIENIIFLGAKENPYPYLQKSDALLMSSEYEGYPVVFIESKILGKPIITTDVSDSKKEIDKICGIVVEKTEEGVYNGMQEFLKNGYTPKEFNPKEYNEKILKKIEEII